MSSLAVPRSPKHGYGFDGQERDVRRSRKPHRCTGAVRGRGGGPGSFSPDCLGDIPAGSIVVAGITDLFQADRYCCLPCALAKGIIEPA